MGILLQAEFRDLQMHGRRQHRDDDIACDHIVSQCIERECLDRKLAAQAFGGGLCFFDGPVPKRDRAAIFNQTTDTGD